MLLLGRPPPNECSPMKGRPSVGGHPAWCVSCEKLWMGAGTTHGGEANAGG